LRGVYGSAIPGLKVETWGTRRMSDIAFLDDLKTLAGELLEKEKKFLLDEKDEYVAAVVVVITPKERYWEEAEFNDEEEKVAAYAKIVRHAKENGATALITVNSSYVKSVTGSDELANYRWGDLRESGSQRAITVTISGPGIESCGMSLPYAFEDGSVVFGEPTEFEPAIIDLAPDWP